MVDSGLAGVAYHAILHLTEAQQQALAMIDDPPLLTVRRHFQRPSADALAVFAGSPAGHIVDALGGRGALDYRIKPIGAAKSFCGVALTCEAGPADCLAVFGTLDAAQPGDVILCAADSFSNTAVLGDLLLGMMRNCGIAAFVTDGLVRDTPGIRGVGLPCYASGVTPNSPTKTGPGRIGFPAVVGGVAVSAGDIVIGDEDGVVVIPFDRIDQTIKNLAAVRAAENDLEAKVKSGMRKPEFMAKMIPPGRIREVD